MTTYRVQGFLTDDGGGFIASKLRTGQTDADVREAHAAFERFVRKASSNSYEVAELVTDKAENGTAYRWTYTYTDRDGRRSTDILIALTERVMDAATQDA